MQINEVRRSLICDYWSDFKWTWGKHESSDFLCNEISAMKGRRAAREGKEGWREIW